MPSIDRVCDGAAVTRLITPPSASLPYSTLEGPFTTSMRSAASVDRRPMSRFSVIAPAIGSPSISTSTRDWSSPRMAMEVCAGGEAISCSPGMRRRSWFADTAAAASMSARDSTVTLAGVSPTRISRWPTVVTTRSSIAGTASSVMRSGAGHDGHASLAESQGADAQRVANTGQHREAAAFIGARAQAAGDRHHLGTDHRGHCISAARDAAACDLRLQHWRAGACHPQGSEHRRAAQPQVTQGCHCALPVSGCGRTGWSGSRRCRRCRSSR